MEIRMLLPFSSALLTVILIWIYLYNYFLILFIFSFNCFIDCKSIYHFFVTSMFQQRCCIGKDFVDQIW